MSRRCVVLAVVIVLVGTVVANASAATNDRGRALGDGIRVAEGTRLVGDVYPYTLAVNPGTGNSTGWEAYLEVTGTASDVYNDYAAQAQAAGFRSAYNGLTCRYITPGLRTDVDCDGWFVKGRRALLVRVRVCSSCAVPISAATVSHITSNRPPAPPASTFPIERASNDLGISVDADARSRALAARLKVGARVGTNTRFEVAQDSQVLASSDIGRCTDGSVNAVVRGRRLSPDELFDAYQSQMSGQERGLKTAKHRSGRTTVLEALDDFNRVVVVARDGSKPTALLTECGDA